MDEVVDLASCVLGQIEGSAWDDATERSYRTRHIVSVLLERDPVSKKVTNLALMFVQVRLEKRTDAESAMQTVDPLF